VGLVTGTCFAEFGVNATCVDVDRVKIAQLQEGKVPIYEPGLEEMVRRNLREGRLVFSTDLAVAVEKSQVIFIAVGTPSTPSGEIDLSYVKSSAQSIGQAIAKSSKRSIVILKSTVISGTARSLLPILEKYSGKVCGKGFGLCSNPEFLREGQAIHDTIEPNRIVIGPIDGFSRGKVLSFYRKFYGKQMPPVVDTSPETAEMIKYASNAFLATKISFINLMARLCERIPGSDVNDVAKGMGYDPRIGSLFLQAGPGFGGSCFPKDVQALVQYAKTKGVDPSLLESTLAINETQPGIVAAKAEEMLGGLKGRNIAVLGLAFNPDTDDVRESRAIPLIRKLVEKGASVGAYDPMAMEGAKKELGSAITYCSNVRECIKGSELVIIMTAWPEFKELDSGEMARLMGGRPRVLDARRIYKPETFVNADFAATGLGATHP